MVVRTVAVYLLLTALAAAEDRVHLRSGRFLTGTIVSETETQIVLDVGAGTITLPRTRIVVVERGVTAETPGAVKTPRDEWFLVLHRKKVVGWRRILHTESATRCMVEERVVFFREGGGDDISIHRVETADAAGVPRDFLYRERYGSDEESAWGSVRDGKLHAFVRSKGEQRNVVLSPPEGWAFPLVAWSRFMQEAHADQAKTVLALDPRRMRFVRLLLRRDVDASAISNGKAKPYHTLSLKHGGTVARALFRPGEGSHTVELNGSTLIALRVPRERVEMARKKHAEKPPDLMRAQNPYLPVEKELRVRHLQSGVTLEAPDGGWEATSHDRERGLAIEFSKIGLFASVEMFVYDLPDPDATAADCFGRALARLKLTAQQVEPEAGAPRDVEVGGHQAKVLVLAVRHRSEELRCKLAVVRGPDRYVVLLGAAPKRWWRWTEPAFDKFLASLEVSP